MEHRHALVVIGGDGPDPAILARLDPVDLVIGADSGFDHAVALGLEPHVVIGDMDSIDPIALARARRDGVSVIERSPDKDETDTELALRHAVESGASAITVLAGRGDRLDHVLGVFAALAAPHLDPVRSLGAWIGSDRVHVARPTRAFVGRVRIGTTVSLVPLAGDAHGVTTHGLRWGLADETLSSTSARGVSNLATADDVRVTLRGGALAVVVPLATETERSES